MNITTINNEISNYINKLDLASTHEPPSVAAGCILLVVNMYSLPINKKQISEVFSISDVTISKTYRRIWPFHKIITNSEITDMILEKKQNLPKQKININKDNLIVIKNKNNNTNIDSTESDNILNDFDEEEEVEEVIKTKKIPKSKKEPKSNTLTI